MAARMARRSDAGDDKAELIGAVTPLEFARPLHQRFVLMNWMSAKPFSLSDAEASTVRGKAEAR